MLPGRGVITSSRQLLSEHSALPVTVLVGLEGPVSVSSGGRQLALGQVVVVPPRTPHSSVGGATLNMFFAPTSFPGAAALGDPEEAGRRGPYAVGGRLGAMIADAARSERNRVGNADVLAGLSDEVLLRFPGGKPRSVDPRVEILLDALGPLGFNVGPASGVQAELPDFRSVISQIARRGNITRAHLSALFVRDAELQLRTYLRWLRLSTGLRLLPCVDATTAAHQAGFADLAHFSRDCRAALGASPTGLVRNLIV